jgi:hypothetical protein
LLEVMLATAVFSLAVVGLARGLGDMIGVLGDTVGLQNSQRALDSAAMRILATSNRIPPRESWVPVPGQAQGGSLVRQRVERVERVRLATAPGQMEVPALGWVVVRLRADQGAESSEELVFLCNEIR